MLVALFACNDSGVTAFNAGPGAAILSPEDGASVAEHFTLEGSATDPDHSDDQLTVTWTVNGEVVCEGPPAAGGLTSCVLEAVEGELHVQLDVVDDLDARDRDEVTLVVAPNQAPEEPLVSITPERPEEGMDLLSCSAPLPLDPDGDEVSLSYSWTVDGADWGAGAEVSGDTLAGEVWACTAVASDGELESTGSASVTIVDCETARDEDSPWSFGSVEDSRDGQIYRTIDVGGVTWMAQNLNYGALVAAADMLTDNGAPEKWCADDDTFWCSAWGGFYNRDEAMGWADYTTAEGAQGACMPGWHVPSKGEWEALASQVAAKRELIDVCEGDGSGTDTVGFGALLTGHRSWGNIENEGHATFWTSTWRGSESYNWSVNLQLSEDPVEFQDGSNPAENGHALRCVKD